MDFRYSKQEEWRHHLLANHCTEFQSPSWNPCTAGTHHPLKYHPWSESPKRFLTHSYGPLWMNARSLQKGYGLLIHMRIKLSSYIFIQSWFMVIWWQSNMPWISMVQMENPPAMLALLLDSKTHHMLRHHSMSCLHHQIIKIPTHASLMILIPSLFALIILIELSF